MVNAAMGREPALRGRGTLWATTGEQAGAFDLRRAIFYAFWVEAAIVVGLLSVNFQVATDAPRKPTIMRPVAPDAPAPALRDDPPPEIHHVLPKRIEMPAPAPDFSPLAADSLSPEVPALPGAPTLPDMVSDPARTDTAAGPAAPAIRRGIAPLLRVEPSYPRSAHRTGTEGRVVAHLYIRPDGTVERVAIVELSPHGVFDREAIAALLQWRFAREAVGFVGEVEIVFKLAPG